MKERKIRIEKNKKIKGKIDLKSEEGAKIRIDETTKGKEKSKENKLCNYGFEFTFNSRVTGKMRVGTDSLKLKKEEGDHNSIGVGENHN